MIETELMLNKVGWLDWDQLPKFFQTSINSIHYTQNRIAMEEYCETMSRKSI